MFVFLCFDFHLRKVFDSPGQGRDCVAGCFTSRSPNNSTSFSAYIFPLHHISEVNIHHIYSKVQYVRILVKCLTKITQIISRLKKYQC